MNSTLISVNCICCDANLKGGKDTYGDYDQPLCFDCLRMFEEEGKSDTTSRRPARSLARPYLPHYHRTNAMSGLTWHRSADGISTGCSGPTRSAKVSASTRTSPTSRKGN